MHTQNPPTHSHADMRAARARAGLLAARELPVQLDSVCNATRHSDALDHEHAGPARKGRRGRGRLADPLDGARDRLLQPGQRPWLGRRAVVGTAARSGAAGVGAEAEAVKWRCKGHPSDYERRR